MFSVEIGLLSLFDDHLSLLGAVMLSLFTLAGAWLGAVYMDSIGRRRLLVFGCIGLSLAWLGASVSVSTGDAIDRDASDDQTAISSYACHVLFAAFLFVASFVFHSSLHPVSWALPAEIFPLWSRGKAVSLTCSMHMLSEIATACVVPLWVGSAAADLVQAMLTLSGVAVAMGLLFFLTVPETRGVMLEEMDSLFAPSESERSRRLYPNFRQVRVGIRSLLSMSSASPATDRPDIGGSQSKRLSSTGAVTVFEPTSLHKYSADLREGKFEYLVIGEDWPLLPPSALIATGHIRDVSG